MKKTGTIRGKSREVEVFRSLNKPKAWQRNAENYQEGMTIGFIRNMNGVASAGETVTNELPRGRAREVSSLSNIIFQNQT